MSPLHPSLFYDHDSVRVRTVLGLYKSSVKKVFGKWVNVAEPSRYGKGHKSALDFWTLIGSVALIPADLMDKAVQSYSLDFCREKWHRDYPPVWVVLGQKNRARLYRDWKDRVPESEEQGRDRARKIVATMGERLGIPRLKEMVQAGWPADPVLRRFLLQEMEHAS